MDRNKLPQLSSLRPFEASARLESFTLAAAEIGVTQAAVSKQIRALEADLGTTLFERRSRSVYLTEDGKQFAKVVSRALFDLRDEAARLRGARRPGEVVLMCQLCEAFYWLMPRLHRFHARFPEVELRVLSTTRPIAEANERFDVALQSSGRSSGSFDLAFTASDAIFPVCAPSMLAGKTLPMSVEDLPRYPLLAHDVTPSDWVDWNGWLHAIGHLGRSDGKVLAFDSYPIMRQAAVAGQGFALGWQRTVEDLILGGKLVAPCEERLERPAEISVYKDGARTRNEKIDDLLDWLKSELA